MSSLQLSCCGGICGFGWSSGLATQHRYMTTGEESLFWRNVSGGHHKGSNKWPWPSDWQYKLDPYFSDNPGIKGDPVDEFEESYHPDCLTATGWHSGGHLAFWNQAVRYTNHPYRKWGGLTTGGSEVRESRHFGGHEYLEVAPPGSEHARGEDKEWLYKIGDSNSQGEKRRQVEYNPWGYFDEYAWVTAQLKYNTFDPIDPWLRRRNFSSRTDKYARYTAADGVHIEQKEPSCNRTKNTGAIIAKDVVLFSKWSPGDSECSFPEGNYIIKYIHGSWLQEDDSFRPQGNNGKGVSYTREQATELFRRRRCWCGWDWNWGAIPGGLQHGLASPYHVGVLGDHIDCLFNALQVSSNDQRPDGFFKGLGRWIYDVHYDAPNYLNVPARKYNDYRTSRVWLGPWINMATGTYGSSSYDDSNLGNLKFYDHKFYEPYLYGGEGGLERFDTEPKAMVANFPGPTRTVYFDFVQPRKGYRDVSDLGLEDNMGNMIELLDKDTTNSPDNTYQGVYGWDSDKKKVDYSSVDTTNGSGAMGDPYAVPYVVSDTDKYDTSGLEGRSVNRFDHHGIFTRGDDLYSPLKRVGSVVGLSISDGHSWSARGADLILNTVMGVPYKNKWEDKPDWYTGGCWNPDDADWIADGGLPWENSDGEMRKGEWRIGNGTDYPCSWIWGLENWSEETSNCVYDFSVQCSRMYHGYCKAPSKDIPHWPGSYKRRMRNEKVVVMPVTDWFVVTPRINGEIGELHGIATPNKRHYYASFLIVFPESKWGRSDANNKHGDWSFEGFGIAGGAPNPLNTTGCNFSLLVNQETWCQAEEHFEVRKPTLTTGGEYDHDDYTVIDRFSSTYLVSPFHVVSKDQSGGRPFTELFNKIKGDGGTGTDVPWPTIKNIQVNKPTTVKI